MKPPLLHPLNVMLPTGIAVDLKDAVIEAHSPELVGRLVQILYARGVITTADARYILPQSYTVE